jgi:hypothetical protein
MENRFVATENSEGAVVVQHLETEPVPVEVNSLGDIARR